MAKILILETEYGRFRELWYSSCVAKEYVPTLKATGHEIIEVSKPYPADANRVIADKKPDLVWWCGHGSWTATTLERVRLWIRKPDFNTDILNDRVGLAESCKTGAELGPYLTTKKKCISYLGYKGSYWFMWCADPYHYNCACSGRNPWGVREKIWAKLVRSMHDATFHFVLGLAKGMTTGEANEYSLKKFDEWIKYCEDIKPKDAREARVIRTTIWVLKTDKDHQVLCGKTDHKIPPPGVPPIPEWVPYAAGSMMLGAMLGGIMSYREELEELGRGLKI